MRTTASHLHHFVRWSPESRVGRWTLALAGLAVGGVIGSALAFRAGLEPADSFSDNWLLTGAGVAILASGAASVVTGAFAMIRRHDRSSLVLMATVLGFLITALMLQQVAEGIGWLQG